MRKCQRVTLKVIAPLLVAAAVVVGLPLHAAGTGSKPASAAEDPVVVAAGDIACDPADANFNGGLGTPWTCGMMRTSDAVLDANPAAVLALGDNQYSDGQLSKFQASYDITWGRFKSLIHPAIGNHEYNDPAGGAAGYFNYFGDAAGDPAKGYYSWDLGSWHLIGLNSECSRAGGCGPGSPQEAWLRNDLADHSNNCTLAYWHEPRWSSGQHGSDADYDAIWTDLYNANADLVLVGHDHDYERFAPQGPDGNYDPRGVREFVVGTGGKNHYPVGAPIANSEVRNGDTFGVLKLTLHPASYDWQFVPEAGGSFTDSGTSTCSAETTPSPSVFDDDFESGDLSRWTTVTGLGTDSTEVHAGSLGARATSTSGNVAYAAKQLSSVHTGLSYKLWFKLLDQGSNPVDLLKLRMPTSTVLLGVYVSPTGLLAYRNFVAGVTASSQTTVTRGVWHSLEVRTVIDDANGRVETWLDGEPVAELTNAELLGTTPIGRIQLGENISGRTYDVAFDDVTLVALDTTPPSVPSALTAEAAETSVTLSWSASTDDVGVAGYSVYLGDNRIASTGGTSYTVSGLVCGTSYDFAVEAYDAAGNRSGRTPISVSTLACPTSLFDDDFESGDFSRWTTVTGLGTDSTEVHAGSWGARATSTSGTVAYTLEQLSSAQSGISYKLWFKLLGQGTNVVDLLKLRTATGAAALTVFASPTGMLGYQNNVTTLSTYSKTPVSSGAWHSLEVRTSIDDTNSQVQTFLDGQPVADLTKTESLGTTPIGRIQLGENITGRTYDVAFDDVSVTAWAP
jgi:chitodextrinase